MLTYLPDRGPEGPESAPSRPKRPESRPATAVLDRRRRTGSGRWTRASPALRVALARRRARALDDDGRSSRRRRDGLVVVHEGVVPSSGCTDRIPCERTRAASTSVRGVAGWCIDLALVHAASIVRYDTETSPSVRIVMSQFA